MSVKSDISFLLNPRSSEDTSRNAMTPPTSPPSFQRLMALAQSPEATTTSSSLLLLSSCIAPMEKMNANIKTEIPQLSLAALCEASSASSCSSGDSSDEEPEIQQAVVIKTPVIEKSKPKAKTTRKRVRKNRNPPCQVEGCKNIAVSRGCCVRHGGGSRCKIEGCPNRAKLYKLCFQHGGFKTCATEGCTRKSKRYGHCWSHGGGRICVIPNCDKVSTQGGLCWAHGGGNRCKLEGCTRRSYQKYGYYCVDHVSLNTNK